MMMFSEIIVDNKIAQKELVSYVKKIAQEHSAKIKILYRQNTTFEKYDVEKQIKESLKTKVHLKSGGSIVIEAAEAMTVVDVNT